MAKDPLSEGIKASKKIRIYPDNPENYHQALTLYRRAYNLAVEHYKNYKDKRQDIRMDVKDICKKEQLLSERIYNSLIIDNAVLAAKRTYKKYEERTGFKSRKGDIHTFAMDRFPKKNCPAKHVLGKIYITEDIPQEAYNKGFTVTYNKGRWYLQVQQKISIKAENQGLKRCISIDPGVRTFATCYSESEALVVGDNLSVERLYPLMKKVDRLLSWKKKLENTDAVEEQWYQDRLKYLNKRIQKLKCKKDDILLDMHHQLSYYLVSNYDVIFLPSFETKKNE
jgi:putative transposase